MKKLRAWKTTLREEGFGLNPYAVSHRLEKRLRKEINQLRFKKVVKAQLPDLQEWLTDTTIAYLYERCLQTRVEKEVLSIARKIVKDGCWHQSHRKATQLQTELSGYLKCNPEKVIRKVLRVTLGNRSYGHQSETGLEAARLLEGIGEIFGQAEHWRRSASLSPWAGFYRDAIVAMNKYLLKNHLCLKKKDRVAIITVAVDAFGLKSEVSDENIARLLLRITLGKRLRFRD